MQFEKELWKLARTGSGPDSLLQIASLLAAYDPEDAGWGELASPIAKSLVDVKATDLGHWMNMLQPVRASLIPHLSEICRDSSGAFNDLEKKRATEILFDYASDSPVTLVELLLEAGSGAFKTLFPQVERASDEVIPLLRAEFDRGRGAEDSSAERHVTAAVALLSARRIQRWSGPCFDIPRTGTCAHTPSTSLHRLDADPQPLIERLNATDNDHERRPRVLALGEYGTELASDQIFVDSLERLFQENDHPGVHGSSRWALSRVGRTHRVGEIEEQLAELEHASTRDWYVNPIQQTFVLVDGTKPFQMGSPDSEVGREEFENQHQKRIGRKFAIASTEVTNLQFRACLSDH